MPNSVEIVDVGPRDGLQNEKTVVSLDAKVELIRRLIDAGIRRMEVGSFVNPKRVPQMADTEEVIARLPDGDCTYIGLVLNMKGAERALATKVHQLGAVCVASDTFAGRNQGQTAMESAEVAAGIVRFGRTNGREGHVTIGASFGCPFEGEVPPERVIEMAKLVAEADPVEVSLADTIGVAVPARVSDLVGRVIEAIAPIPVRGHFHDTRNTGVANAWAAVQAGVKTLDASVGGLGGCPFAPAATGNVATEDVIYMLTRSGVETGVSVDSLVDIVKWFGAVLDRPLPGMVSRAGNFPARESDKRRESGK